MKAKEFVKKFGWEASKKYISKAHKKATHIYIGYMGTASYFYQHPNLNWCEVDKRTVGWDSDRCCYDVHPPVSSMFVIEELKTLVDAWELVESYGGLEESKSLSMSQIGLKKHYEGLQQATELVESCDVK